MKSKFLKLGVNDFIKGAVIAILTAIGTVLTIDEVTIKKVALAALVGFISYLTKNLFTNSQDKILKTD